MTALHRSADREAGPHGTAGCALKALQDGAAHASGQGLEERKHQRWEPRAPHDEAQRGDCSQQNAHQVFCGMCGMAWDLDTDGRTLQELTLTWH